MTTHVLKKSQGKEQPLLVCEIIREVGIVKNPNAFESVVLNGGNGVFADPLRSSRIRRHHGHLVSTADKTTSEFIRHARCAAILESGIEIRNDESNAHPPCSGPQKAAFYHPLRRRLCRNLERFPKNIGEICYTRRCACLGAQMAVKQQPLCYDPAAWQTGPSAP